MATVIGSLSSATQASAHGDQGKFAPVSVDVNEERVEVVVALLYAGDGHPVPDATVIVVAEHPDGGAVGPTEMEPDGEGNFSTTLVLPAVGQWSMRLDALKPMAQLTLVADVEVVSPDATNTTTSAPGNDSAPADLADPNGDQASGSTDTTALVSVALVVAAVSLAAGAVLWARRRPGAHG